MRARTFVYEAAAATLMNMSMLVMSTCESVPARLAAPPMNVRGRPVVIVILGAVES
jgi:hypothetical protein